GLRGGEVADGRAAVLGLEGPLDVRKVVVQGDRAVSRNQPDAAAAGGERGGRDERHAGERRCRGAGAKRPHWPYSSRSASESGRRGSPSRGWPTLPGFSSHSPLRSSSRLSARRVSPVAGWPSSRSNDSATWEWPSRLTRWRVGSKHSSASSADRTYSQ